MPPRIRPRTQGPGGPRAPIVGPAVQKEDTYRPFTGNAASEQFRQLARGLGQFSQTLEGIGRDVGRRQQEHDLEAGRQAFYDARDSQAEWKNLQKQGVPPDMNPWRRMGWQLAAGADAAMRYEADLASASEAALAGATSMDEVRDFERQFRQAWEQDNLSEAAQTEAFKNGFLPASEAALAKFNREWGERVSKQFLQAEADAIGGEVMGKLRVMKELGYDTETIGAELTAIADRAYAGGQNPRASEIVIGSAMVAALTNDDLLLLDAIGEMETGPARPDGSRLRVKDTPRFAQKLDEAALEVAKRRKERRQAEEEQRKWEDKKAYEGIETDLLADLNENVDNPWAVDFSAYRKRAVEAGLGQDYIDLIDHAADAWRDENVEGNELVADDYFISIGLATEGLEGIRRDILTDRRLNRSQRSSLLTALESASKRKNGQSDPDVGDLERDLRLVFRPELAEKFDVGSALVNAFSWATPAFIRWKYGEGQGATPEQIAAKRQEFVKQAVQRFWPASESADLPSVMQSIESGTPALLEAAGVEKDPMADPILTAPQAEAYFAAYRAWLADDSADLPPGLLGFLEDYGLNEDANTALQALYAQRALNGYQPDPRRRR